MLPTRIFSTIVATMMISIIIMRIVARRVRIVMGLIVMGLIVMRLIVMRLIVVLRTLLTIDILIPPLALLLNHMRGNIVCTPFRELTV